MFRPAPAPGQPGGGPQIWCGSPDRVILATVAYDSDNIVDAVQFRVTCPDSRLRTKISLIYVPTNPADAHVAFGAGSSIWMCAEEWSHSQSTYVATTDVLRQADGTVVTQAAPLDIPESADLRGFSQEFVTAADAIRGELSTSTLMPSGHWELQCRWQPDGQRLCDADWEWVKRACNFGLCAPPLNF